MIVKTETEFFDAGGGRCDDRILQVVMDVASSLKSEHTRHTHVDTRRTSY